MSDQIDRKLWPRAPRCGSREFFGALTPVLLSVGVYGTPAYAVGQRTKEIGVRLALGAVQASIISMVFRQIAAVIALGVDAGMEQV